MPVNTLIQVRRGNASVWSSGNPTLSAGEIGYELDTKLFKIGDGTTVWNSLKYAAVPPSGTTVEDFSKEIYNSLIAGSGISLSFNNTTKRTTISSDNPDVQLSDITDLSSDGRNFLLTGTSSGLRQFISDETGSGSLVFSSGATLTNTTLAGTVTVGSDSLSEVIEDTIGTKVKGSSSIAVNYNDSTGETTLSITGVAVSGHTHVLADITDVSATATQVNYLASTTPGTVSVTKAVVVDSNKNITGFNNITSSGTISAATLNTTGNVTVGGNLNVQGTTTTVNSTTVEIGDNVIRVNTSGLNTGGFEVFDGVGYQSLVWDNVDNRWEFTGAAVQSTGNIVGRTLESTVAGPTAPLTVASTGLVTNLNSDLLDGQHGSHYLNYNNLSNTPTIGSGTLTLSVSGSGLSGSASFGANATGNTTFTVTSNATPANTANTVVSRDSSGNFTATNITASGFIGDGSSLTSLNANNLSSGTVSSGLLPNVSVGSTATGPTGSFVSSVTTDAKGRVTSVNTTTHTLATTSTKGIASFDSSNFSVAAGAVSIKTSGISNTQLANNSVTIGQTPLVLGSTYSAISGVSAANPVVLTYFAIDGGSP